MNMKSSNSSAKKITEEYAETVWNAKEIDVIDRLVNKDVLIHQLGAL